MPVPLTDLGCTAWVEQVVQPVEAGDLYAHDHLLFALSAGGQDTHAQLCPLIAATLLRQAEAREAGVGGPEGDRANETTERECCLARLLCREDLNTTNCDPWINHLFAIITSAKAQAELKIVLLEFLSSNRRAPDVRDLIPFVMGRVVDETHDKTRACAVLALEALSRMKYGNEDKLENVGQLLVRLWDEERGLGLLTKAALALVSLRHLKPQQLPTAAIDHALLLIGDSCDDVRAAWQAVRGGDSLLTRGNEKVAITEVVSEGFLQRVQAQLDGFRARAELRNRSLPSFLSPLPTVPVLQAPGLRPASFTQLLSDAILKLEIAWAKQEVVPRLLDHLAKARKSTHLVSCLLDLLLPGPLVEGVVVQELDTFTVGVLRQLAFESRFADTLWQWSEMAERLEAKGLPASTRAALQGFLDAPLPQHLASLAAWVRDFEALDDEPWATLHTAFGPASDMPPLIRGLGSRFPEVQKRSFQALADMVSLEGTRYSATPVVAKWVAALLDYPWVTNTSDILRFLTAAGLHLAGFYLLAGCDGRLPEPQEQAAYDEMSKHTAKYIRLAHEGDEQTRLDAIFLLAMLPGQWRSTLPLLADMACAIAQPLAVRASALSALSFVAPVHDSGSGSSADPTSAAESAEHTNQERLDRTRRAIAILASFLPPLAGEVVSLRDAAAARLSRVVVRATSTSTAQAGAVLSILPEELQRLVAHHSLANDPATRRYFQRHAALGICRLVLRARGVSGRDMHLLLPSFRPPEGAKLELELELELQRWLPAVKQVLIDCILDPAAHDVEGADTMFKRPDIEQLYLTKFKLLGDDVAGEMRDLFIAKLGDPDVSERTVSVVVDELIDLAFPSKFGLMRVHQNRSAPDYNATGWNDDQRQVMSSIVRCGRVWADRDRERKLCVKLQDRLDSISTPSRHSLAYALGLDVP